MARFVTTNLDPLCLLSLCLVVSRVDIRYGSLSTIPLIVGRFVTNHGPLYLLLYSGMVVLRTDVGYGWYFIDDSLISLIVVLYGMFCHLPIHRYDCSDSDSEMVHVDVCFGLLSMIPLIMARVDGL